MDTIWLFIFCLFVIIFYIIVNRYTEQEKLNKEEAIDEFENTKTFKYEEAKAREKLAEEQQENRRSQEIFPYLLREAKKQTNMNAMYELSNCYYKGIGTQKNYVEAIYWIFKSETLGHADAPNLRKEIEEVASELQRAVAVKRLNEETPE